LGYNIRIESNTDANIKDIVNNIARMIEQSTGKRCRISIINRRSDNKHRKDIEKTAVNQIQQRQ